MSEKRMSLYVQAIDKHLISKKVVFNRISGEVESESEYITFLEIDELEMQKTYERDLKEKHLKTEDYIEWLRNENYGYVCSTDLQD